jgi:hypothetical protein
MLSEAAVRRALCRSTVWLCFVVPVLPAVAADPSGDDELVRIEHAIAAGSAFLVQQQEPDGTWRSKTYGLLKDGTSLTPLAAWALATEEAGHAARDRSFQWMSNWFVRRRGQISLVDELQYPVYAAGLCLPTWNRADVVDARAQVVAWTDLIRSLQLSDANGWSFDDPRYGGWGYSHEPPRKPGSGAALSGLRHRVPGYG